MEISSTKPRQLSSRRLTSIDSEADRPVGVQRITVQRLFGQFDYDLKSETTDLSDLFILYGDNGSGKTTLLRLLFYILSRARAAGHRTAIQEIPFERFEVLLVDKTSIVLWRKNSIAGAYSITFSQVGMKPVTVSFGAVTDRENRFATPEEEEAFSSFIENVNLTVYLLSADRRIQSDLIKIDDEAENSEPLFFWRTVADPASRVRMRVPSYERLNKQDEQTCSVTRAMQLASSWIRGQVLQAANKGTSSSHNTYADVVRRIVATRPQQDARPESKEQVINANRKTGIKRLVIYSSTCRRGREMVPRPHRWRHH